FTNCNKNFKMPLKVITDKKETLWLEVSTSKNEMKFPAETKMITVDPNFYVTVKQGLSKK
ncbi:MAG: hypothetical protein ACXVO9_08760, partial [Bacteroidia bacterium]